MSSNEEISESIITLLASAKLESVESFTPPIEEWSSLEVFTKTEEYNEKHDLYNRGLYDPGSGEICAKYVAMSDSDVLMHPYYRYPAVKDPGILASLNSADDTKVYPPDGQELYLELCREMNIAPANIFYHGLKTSDINMRYYGVCSNGIRAMCLALENNPTVTRFDLSSNFLSLDACYHLGCLLGTNHVLKELLLSQCNISTDGLRRLAARLKNCSLDLLDISSNKIDDEGFHCFIEQFERGCTVKRLDVSRNALASKTADALAEVCYGYNAFTHLDLSWNYLGIDHKSVLRLLRGLASVHTLVNLKLTHNSISSYQALHDLINSSIRKLDLSNNKLYSDSVRNITRGLNSTRRLKTLNLSSNPLTSEDALRVLEVFDHQETMQGLYLNNVDVEPAFVNLMTSIKARRPNITITHGRIVRDFELSDPDLKEIVLKRFDYLSKGGKKAKPDFCVYCLTLEDQGVKFQDVKSTFTAMRKEGLPGDEDLLNQAASCFPGPLMNKGEKSINISGICEYIRRMFPNKEPLPPEEESDPAPSKSEKLKKADPKTKNKKKLK